MVGRGTRLCPDLYGPGDHKKFFYLFDYCQNLEFFSQNPDTTDGSGCEALGVRLFKARLSLIDELDRKAIDGQQVNEPPAKCGPQPDHSQLRDSTAGLLHQVVAAINVENSVVRPQWRSVEKFARPEAWKALTGGDLTALADHIASLPTEMVDADEEAKCFDLLVYAHPTCHPASCARVRCAASPYGPPYVLRWSEGPSLTGATQRPVPALPKVDR